VLARLFLVVALLAGWQSAIVHPLSHVDGQGQLVHLGEGSKHSSNASCDVLAALTACAPIASAIIAVPPPAYESPVHHVGAPRAAEAPPFHSQGPPAVL
jgi:hypothetical protein